MRNNKNGWDGWMEFLRDWGIPLHQKFLILCSILFFAFFISKAGTNTYNTDRWTEFRFLRLHCRRMHSVRLLLCVHEIYGGDSFLYITLVDTRGRWVLDYTIGSLASWPVLESTSLHLCLLWLSCCF